MNNIEKVFLSELDINDSFFDSFKNDYYGFSSWFFDKQDRLVYITRSKGNIRSFLMMKFEDESERYEDFIDEFVPLKRMKICTFKVLDSGMGIGEEFIRIIESEAKKNDVSEIYVTIFDKYKKLIDFFLEYGFYKYTKRKTIKSDKTIELENVLVKKCGEFNE